MVNVGWIQLLLTLKYITMNANPLGTKPKVNPNQAVVDYSDCSCRRQIFSSKQHCPKPDKSILYHLSLAQRIGITHVQKVPDHVRNTNWIF